LALFFYLGRFKASTKQTDRGDRINWSMRKFSLGKIFLYGLVFVSAIALVTILI